MRLIQLPDADDPGELIALAESSSLSADDLRKPVVAEDGVELATTTPAALSALDGPGDGERHEPITLTDGPGEFNTVAESSALIDDGSDEQVMLKHSCSVAAGFLDFNSSFCNMYNNRSVAQNFVKYDISS